MSPGKNALRVLALSIIAIVAFATAAASAQASPDWTIKELTLAELGQESETIEGSGGSLTIDVTKLGIKIECSEQSLTGKISQGGKGTSTVKLSKCTVVGAEKTCTVVEPLTLKISHALTEVTETIYDVIAAESGETIATVELKGEACPLAKSVKLTGKAASTVGKEETTLTLTFSKEAATATESQLLYGANTATLSGTMKFKLGGANAGQPVGAVRLTTALCNTQEDPCLGPKTFGPNNILEGQLEGMAELSRAGMPTFSCTTSTLTGENLVERGQPMTILFSTLVFGGCGSGCSVPKTGFAAGGTLRYRALGIGTLTIIKPLIETKCAGQKCEFEKATGLLRVEGGNPAKAKAELVPLSLKATNEGTCPSTLFWKATYKITALGSMFVTR